MDEDKKSEAVSLTEQLNRVAKNLVRRTDNLKRTYEGDIRDTVGRKIREEKFTKVWDEKALEAMRKATTDLVKIYRELEEAGIPKGDSILNHPVTRYRVRVEIEGDTLKEAWSNLFDVVSAPANEYPLYVSNACGAIYVDQILSNIP